MGIRFGIADKIAFYLNYFASKFFYLWFEVRRPKLRMFIYEMLYSAMKFIDRESLMKDPFGINNVETEFGKFNIRPHTADLATVSPAFERRDVSYLIRLIDGLKNEGRRLLFLDIGSDVGTFAVTVGNRLKGYEPSRVMAFEPAPSSFALLNENIRLNGLDDIVETHNTALFSEDDKELYFNFNSLVPGSSGIADAGELKVRTKTLNSILRDGIPKYDVFILKIDVEGVETDVLKGASELFNSGREVYLLIEDFVNPAIIGYLEEKGALFVKKLTPYNSWWRYQKVRPA